MNEKSKKGSDGVRLRLIHSAAKLFLQKNFNSVSIRELAEVANTSSGMIAYYFKSKNKAEKRRILFSFFQKLL